VLTNKNHDNDNDEDDHDDDNHIQGVTGGTDQTTGGCSLC